MTWINAHKQKPMASTPMETHRVIVWLAGDRTNQLLWTVGWWIAGALNEWRIEGSPNAQDVDFWMDITAPEDLCRKMSKKRPVKKRLTCTCTKGWSDSNNPWCPIHGMLG